MPRKRLKKKYLYYKGYRGKLRMARWCSSELAVAYIKAIRLAKQIKLALEKFSAEGGAIKCPTE